MSEENTGSFSVDDAVAALSPSDELNTQHEVETDAGDTAPVETNEEISQDDPLEGLEIDDSDAADEPSETDDEDEGSDEDDGEDEESQLDPIDAPEFWEAADKEAFKSLSREAQELIAKQDHKGRAAVSKAIEQAGVERKAAENLVKALASKQTEVEQLLSKVSPHIASKWADVDWPQYHREYPAEAADAWQRFQADKQMEANLEAEANRLHQIGMQEYHQAERAKLAAMAENDPVAKALMDPVKGQENLDAVGKYLFDLGFDAQRLNDIAATELNIAFKAMKYDQLISKQKAKPTTTPNVKNTGTQGAKMRPAATPAQPRSHKSVEAMDRRLSRSGSMEDAVALLAAKELTRNKRK